MKSKKYFSIAIILTLLICVIALFINNEIVTAIDSWFYDVVSKKMNPNRTLFMRLATESGSTAAVIILCLSFFLFPKLRKTFALPVTTSVAAAAFLNIVLKTVFARQRPNVLQLISESYYSFPSGHAMVNMAFYTMIFLLTRKNISNKKTKAIISIICIASPLIIGFSRIYLGVHYVTDVLAGWAIGFSVSIIIFNMFEKWKNNK